VSLLLLLFCGTLYAAAPASPQPAIVVIPVADVWSRPLVNGEPPTDDLRETQVLNGEKVLIHESSGAWVRIEAPAQQEFTHHGIWEGYPGWVLAASLSLKPQSQKETYRPPEDILQFAESKKGLPYCWGGMSTTCGFDCSGLVHLAYRTHGLEIPRDAHEQWMKAKSILRTQLKPADLIFSAKAVAPKKITHVALYAGDGMIIEAPQTGMVVRKISFKDKYGKNLSEVESGDRVGDRIIYFGTFQNH